MMALTSNYATKALEAVDKKAQALQDLREIVRQGAIGRDIERNLLAVLDKAPAGRPHPGREGGRAFLRRLLERSADGILRDSDSAELQYANEYTSFLSKLAAKYVSEQAGIALMPNRVQTLNTTISPRGPSIRKCQVCVACADEFTWFEIFQLACAQGHVYCSACLTRLFSDSFKTENKFPPKCCRLPILVEDPELPLFVPQSLRKRYPLRRLELETKNRTYCCDPKSGSFIAPAHISVTGQAFCEECKTFTCATCRRAAHKVECVTADDEE
jgi:hypothetical protein